MFFIIKAVAFRRLPSFQATYRKELNSAINGKALSKESPFARAKRYRRGANSRTIRRTFYRKNARKNSYEFYHTTLHTFYRPLSLMPPK